MTGAGLPCNMILVAGKFFMRRRNRVRVKGFSTSRRDVVALGAMVAGVGVSVFAGQPIGAVVMGASGSLALGTCAWVLTLLVGAGLFLGGFAWLLTERRTYRHPETVQQHEREKVVV